MRQMQDGIMHRITHGHEFSTPGFEIKSVVTRAVSGKRNPSNSRKQFGAWLKRNDLFFQNRQRLLRTLNRQMDQLRGNVPDIPQVRLGLAPEFNLGVTNK